MKYVILVVVLAAMLPASASAQAQQLPTISAQVKASGCPVYSPGTTGTAILNYSWTDPPGSMPLVYGCAPDNALVESLYLDDDLSWWFNPAFRSITLSYLGSTVNVLTRDANGAFTFPTSGAQMTAPFKGKRVNQGLWAARPTVDTVASNPTFRVRIMIRWKVPPAVHSPIGFVDSAQGGGVTGWAYDEDTLTVGTYVEFFYDGPVGVGTYGGQYCADRYRADLCDFLTGCNHGFGVPIPSSRCDGQPHTVYVYALDLGTGTRVQLTNSPQTFTCP